LKLGVIHPDYLLDKLTGEQLLEWEAYDRIDPIGEWRADLNTASVLSHLTNIVRKLYGRSGLQLTTPGDYMPQWREPVKHKKQNWQDMKDAFLSFAKAHNAKLKKGSDSKKRQPNNPVKKKFKDGPGTNDSQPGS
jgi:hypothetical protein